MRVDTETLIYGIHAVRAALVQGRVHELWLDPERHDIRSRTIREAAAGILCHDRERKVLDTMVPGARHQGVIARCVGQAILNEDNLSALLEITHEPAFLLILDGVQDPHNLGACLRNADAAGVHAVITPRDRAVGLTPTVRKVASGGAETVPFIQVTNLARTLRMLKDNGIWLVGTDGNAPHSLFTANLAGPLALVMGTEGRGLRRLSAEHCDLLVHIPMLGTVESLNVSVATGICLFEALRQRQQIPSR